MSEVVECPVCEADLGRPWGTEFKGHRIVKCAGCGLRYVSPRRSEAENLAIYDDRAYFAHTAEDQGDPGRAELHVQTSLRTCRTILAHCPHPHPTLLDVGTGTGFLPKMAKLLGFRAVVGSDLTDVNRGHLAGFNIPLVVGDVTRIPRQVVLSHLNGAVEAAAGFEVISLMHVLEHVMEPNGFLRGLRELLAPQGLLYLLVPNEGSLPSALKSLASRVGLKKRAFKHLSPGHHLFFFTRRTLERLLAKNGFRVVYAGTCSAEKRRGILGRALHRMADAMRTGTWLEVAALRTD